MVVAALDIRVMPFPGALVGGGGEDSHMVLQAFQESRSLAKVALLHRHAAVFSAVVNPHHPLPAFA
jgi:hypothetical protein